MPNLSKKTTKMVMMEYKHGKDIETLILESLIESNGEQKEAANYLDVSESALCRWIRQLDLTTQVGKIRKTNNLPPTPHEVKSIVDNANLGADSIIENCTECGIKFEKLEMVNVTGVHIKDGQPLAVVRDHLNIKHWFVLNKNLSLI